MSWGQTAAGVWTPEPVRVRAPSAPATAGVGTRGAPAYQSGWGNRDLQPFIDPRLMGHMLQGLPVLGRAVELLAGMVGCPTILTDSERTDAEWQEWAETVGYGWIGQGLDAWIRDHVSQALVYGYAVGEAEIAAGRNEIPRVWSYSSPGCLWRSMTDGSLEIRQTVGMRGTVTLDPLTCLTTTHAPAGSDPRGTSIFRAIPTVAQLQMEMYAAYRSVWRRSGVPIYHVNWRTPETLDDPTGEISAEVRQSLQTSWVDAMKSAVVDGVAKDFFSTGEISIESVGAKSEVMDIESAKRAITEELVVATGIPAWMLGYTWSSTERLSQQQADMLRGTVWALRREIEPVLRKLLDLRTRLLGRPVAYRLEWEDVTLQDLVETAKARLTEAQADESRERLARQLWAQGVYDHTQYAEHVTGSAEVAQARTEPVADAVESPTAPAALESERAYPGAGCKHQHGPGQKAETFPTERPQYAALGTEIARAERAVQQAHAEMRERILQVVRAAKTASRRRGKVLSPGQSDAIDSAIEAFLRELAGSDRSELGYVNGDSGEPDILKRSLDLAARVGADRAAGLAGRPGGRVIPEDLKRRLREESFAQLSDGSRLRFETRLDEIREALVGAFETGEPVEEIIARLTADLDAYSTGRLRTIVRTEMGRASETVLRSDLHDLGVRRVKVIGDPTTDALCTTHIGQEYDLGDVDSLPIYHPNCLCSLVPAEEQD